MSLPVKNTSLATPPKLLDQVRAVIRMKHYNLRTEESYIYWIQGVGYFNYASIFPDSNSDRYFKIPLQNKLSHPLKKYNFDHQKRHSAKKIIELKVNYEEVHIQRLIKSAGRSWNREQKLWQLAYKDVVALGLENRIVLRTEKKGKNA